MQKNGGLQTNFLSPMPCINTTWSQSCSCPKAKPMKYGKRIASVKIVSQENFVFKAFQYKPRLKPSSNMQDHATTLNS
jgi:hypothetical protein